MNMAVLCKSQELNFVVLKKVSQLLKLASISTSTQCQQSQKLFYHNRFSSPHQIYSQDQRENLSCICPQQNNFRKYSSFHYKGNFIAKFSEEIDLDALREQKINELKNSGVNFHVSTIVKELLSEKCDEAISNLNEEDQKKLKIIKLEHDFLFSEGYVIPSPEEMTSENWLEALNLSSKQRRLKYYLAWQKKTHTKENAKKKKALLKAELADSTDVEEKRMSMNHNKILLRVYDSTMKRWLNHRLSSAMQFGIPLVLDMNYEDHMPNREINNTAKQLLDLYCLNRSDEQTPFHIHFTGCPPNNPIYRTFQMLLQDDLHLMTSVTHESYLDLFDKDRLVYLSPNGKQVMREFDPNAVYIVGAFNDKSTQQPISYARAKEHGITCQRLPLDQYLKWHLGTKSLTLNQMISILRDVKNQKSWPEALKAVPSRKFLQRGR